MSSKKSFFVEGTQLIPINGDVYIPSALCYEKKHTYDCGISAIQRLQDGSIVNRNFKIELGNYIPQKLSTHKQFETNMPISKTAFELTTDFVRSILENVEGEASNFLSKKDGLKIIVSEPLSFYTEDNNWIKQYRKNIRSILHAYEDVEFLPEPFAVYQYYRYGFKHPSMQDFEKQIALIVDFGGGTFDVSIIESTNKGDISIKGKHSKPLAASSRPIGGYYVNQVISKYLLLKYLSDDKKSYKKAQTYLKSYERTSKNDIKIEELALERQVFIRNFQRLEHVVEKAKIELSSKISNWELSGEDYSKVSVDVPKNPFNEETQWIPIDFIGHEFKKIFIQDIWNGQIKNVVSDAISRANSNLGDRKLTLTLISGGSSNIRWLGKLINKDLEAHLSNAVSISISHSFQEVVAKGLAIECARRHYDPESEFVAVTYNPVKLVLNPDGKGLESKKFKSVGNSIDMTRAHAGDLLPSAQTLNHFIDEPLQWKVRLKHAPRHLLNYYFTKQFDCDVSEVADQIGCHYNIDNKAHTPKGSIKFGQRVRVELTVKKDGTATPKFIYVVESKDNNIDEVSANGTPFMLDITSISEDTNPNRYIGFDFGTSNSSISYITNEQIQMIQKRDNDPSWVKLKDIIPYMPFPVAQPLKEFISLTDNEHAAKTARQAFEAILSFIAYIALSESILVGRYDPRLMPDTYKLSMGPLRNLIEQATNRLRNKARFSGPIHALMSKYKDALDKACSDFNDHKHDKLAADKFDKHGHLSIAANILHQLLKGKIFGHFDHLKKEAYTSNSYTGIFRCAYDSRVFYNYYSYEGSIDPSTQEPYLIDLETNAALPMCPFLVFNCNSNGKMDCHTYDKGTANAAVYKSTAGNESIEYKPSNKLYELLTKALNGELTLQSGEIGILVAQS